MSKKKQQQKNNNLLYSQFKSALKTNTFLCKEKLAGI